MKKTVTFLGSLSLVAISSMSVISCSTKSVASLNDPSYRLAKAEGDGHRFDIMQWSSDVLASAKYKESFLNLFKEHNLGTSGSQVWSITDLVKGQKDNNGLEPSLKNQEPTTIGKLMSDYQASSTTGDNIGHWTAEVLDQEFIYKIFDANQVDENNDPVLVSTYNENKSGKWLDNFGKEITSKKNKDSGAYVFSFLIAIDASNSEYFTGGRINVSGNNKEDLAKYYKGIKKEAIPTTLEHDYRYKIEFNLQIS